MHEVLNPTSNGDLKCQMPATAFKMLSCITLIANVYFCYSHLNFMKQKVIKSITVYTSEFYHLFPTVTILCIICKLSPFINVLSFGICYYKGYIAVNYGWKISQKKEATGSQNGLPVT